MIDINIEFERECGKCYGSSQWSGVACDRCNNTGRVPTELGVELLEFLERHGIKSIAAEPPPATPGRE